MLRGMQDPSSPTEIEFKPAAVSAEPLNQWLLATGSPGKSPGLLSYLNFPPKDLTHSHCFVCLLYAMTPKSISLV